MTYFLTNWPMCVRQMGSSNQRSILDSIAMMRSFKRLNNSYRLNDSLKEHGGDNKKLCV